MFATLAVAVPAVLAAALLARRPPVLMNVIPTGLGREVTPLPRVLFSRTARAGSVEFEIRVTADSLPPSRLRLGLRPLGDLHLPDPLVYWSGAAAPPDGGLPPDAVLLGSLLGVRPREFELPAAALAADGQVLVYSLGHGALAGEFPLPTHSSIEAAHE